LRFPDAQFCSAGILPPQSFSDCADKANRAFQQGRLQPRREHYPFWPIFEWLLSGVRMATILSPFHTSETKIPIKLGNTLH
jgi:hypothetical protein